MKASRMAAIALLVVFVLGTVLIYVGFYRQDNTVMNTGFAGAATAAFGSFILSRRQTKEYEREKQERRERLDDVKKKLDDARDDKGSED